MGLMIESLKWDEIIPRIVLHFLMFKSRIDRRDGNRCLKIQRKDGFGGYISTNAADQFVSTGYTHSGPGVTIGG